MNAMSTGFSAVRLCKTHMLSQSCGKYMRNINLRTKSSTRINSAMISKKNHAPEGKSGNTMYQKHVKMLYVCAIKIIFDQKFANELEFFPLRI